jgi:cyanophycinase
MSKFDQQFALVGSGEFLPVMTDVDQQLLRGRSKSVAVIPTASALDGEATFQKWLTMAKNHFGAMGVEVRPIEVRSRDEAEAYNDHDRIASAGLVYLSGGNPGYLAATLRDTPVWSAVLAAVANNAAIAGCSAGAMAMSTLAPVVREPKADMAPGLNLIANLAVIPHFDKIRKWVPGIVENYLANAAPGVTIVGIDEDTALVNVDRNTWTVEGRQQVHLIRSATDVEEFPARSVITFD